MYVKYLTQSLFSASTPVEGSVLRTAPASACAPCALAAVARVIIRMFIILKIQ